VSVLSVGSSVNLLLQQLAAGDDDDDDKVAIDEFTAFTVCLVLELSRMLVLAVTDARVFCPVFMAYYISACIYGVFMIYNILQPEVLYDA